MAVPQKRIWKKIESTQRRILRAIFCKNKYESIEQVFEKNNILTAFELYVMEVCREIFKQLKSESPLCIQDGIDLCHYNTRRKEKGFLPLTYCRAVTRAKSVDNRLRKAYNWLKDHDLIPVDLPKVSTAQIVISEKISYLYVKGSRLYDTLFWLSKKTVCFAIRKINLWRTENWHINCFATFLFMLFISRGEARRAA